MLAQWFNVTRVLVEPGCIKVTRGLFGLGATRTIRSDEIEEITAEAGGWTGMKIYHEVRIACKNGTEVSAGGDIGDVREAQWLTQQMTKCLRGERIG